MNDVEKRISKLVPSIRYGMKYAHAFELIADYVEKQHEIKMIAIKALKDISKDRGYSENLMDVANAALAKILDLEVS